MFNFLVICIRMYLAGFRISRSVFHAKDSGLHRFSWVIDGKSKVLDMPDIDWYIGRDGKTHYALMYNGHSTKLS